MRGHTRAVLTSNHPYSQPSKNIWGLLARKIEYSTKMSKKWFSSYYEMEQSCNSIVKTKSFVTRTFLNQSGWDLVWVNIYPRCFDTPNLIPISWETAEFWGLIRFTRPEGCFKWGSKNEPFLVWRPQFSSYNNAVWICCSPIHKPKVLLLGLFGIPFNLATGRAQRRVLWSKIAN